MNGILKNFSFLTAGHTIEKIIKFFIVVVLVRYLLVEEYGQYALAVSFVGMFVHLMDSGLTLFFMRESAKEEGDHQKLMGKIMTVKCIIGPLVGIFIILLAFFLNYPVTILYLIGIYCLSMLLHTFANIFISLFIGSCRAEFASLMIAGHSLFLLAGIFFCVAMDLSVVSVMSIYLVASAALFWAGNALCKKEFFTLSWNLDITDFRGIMKEAVPFALGAIMGEIFFNIDNVMVARMVGIEAVGYYNAAYKLSYSGVLLANTLTLAAYPQISRYWEKEKEKVVRLLQRLCVIIIAIGIVLVCISTWAGHDIILFVFGDAYQQSIVLFRVLVWSLPSLSLMHLTSRALEGIGEQRFVALSMLVSVGINIGLNFLLIGAFGAFGASIATVVTSLFIVVFQGKFLLKKMRGVT